MRNCNTERYGIHRRGYCYRCYPLIIQSEQVERWNVKDRSTWKGFPRSFLSFSQRYLQDEFAKIKAKRLKEFEVRLWLLKIRESQRTGKVSGMDIEEAFRRLARWSGGNEDVMHGIASIVTYHFGPEGRQVLLGWFPKWQQSLLKNPSRIDLPKISQNAGISAGYHHSSYEFCSSFIHGSLYAMQLTEKVNLQTGEGKEFFKQLINIVCGYVALAIRDFKKLFPELPELDPRLIWLGALWSTIVKWETIPGFDEIRRVAHRLEDPSA
jgi:hypothetical protein